MGISEFLKIRKRGKNNSQEELQGGNNPKKRDSFVSKGKVEESVPFSISVEKINVNSIEDIDPVFRKIVSNFNENTKPFEVYSGHAIDKKMEIKNHLL